MSPRNTNSARLSMMDINATYQLIADQIRRDLSPLHWPRLEPFVDTVFRVPDSQPSLGVTLLPSYIAEACGAPPSTAREMNAVWEILLVACKGIDDVADGDLSTSRYAWKEWTLATTTSLILYLWTTAISRITQLRPGDDVSIDGIRRALEAQGEPSAPDRQAYLLHAIGKTGALFAVFSRLGAIAAGAGVPQQEAAWNFGLSLGALHQMANDATDYRKPYANTDFRRGVHTLPLILALESSRHPLHRELAMLSERRAELTEQEWGQLIKILREMSIEKTLFSVLKAYQHKTLSHLEHFSFKHGLEEIVLAYEPLLTQ